MESKREQIAIIIGEDKYRDDFEGENVTEQDREHCRKIADQILALFEPSKEELLTDEEILNIDSPCLKLEPLICPFKDTLECDMCDDREITKAQAAKSKAFYSGLVEQARKDVATTLFEDMICPMCYRLNPQHKTMDGGTGCHWCQDREDWQAIKEGKLGS
jgi:hypothetical protein